MSLFAQEQFQVGEGVVDVVGKVVFVVFWVTFVSGILDDVVSPLLIWQLLPVKREEQVHEKPEPFGKQVPPFKQGALIHGFG